MERRDIRPREGWESRIEQQGLIYWKTPLANGEVISYWHEGAYYALSSTEVYEFEAAARVLLNDLLVPAGDSMIEHNLFARMGIPGWAVDRIKETWESEPPMLYGRFDFAYGPDGVPKLLEYNADTPTCLLETAIQWHWATDVFGEDADQWNSVHEALVARWKEMAEAGRLPGNTVHFLHTNEERSGEDFMTVAYLVETCRDSGLLNPVILPVESLGWHQTFGFLDLDGAPVRNAFKLYPWEWMVHERYSAQAMSRMGTGGGMTQWIEPIWKMLWSNKGILPVLWHLFPDHPNLLPAYFEHDFGDSGGPVPVDVFGEPVGALDWGGNVVRKPLLAREGANSQIVLAGNVVEAGPQQDYGEEGFVVQQYTDLGQYGEAGARPVMGVWTVDMEPVGLGIRESDNFITNNESRFVPHIIDTDLI